MNYDNAGNTTQIAAATAKQFVYDDHGRMVQYKEAGTTRMTYQYNGRGEQVYRFSSGTPALSLYDEAGAWMGDYNAVSGGQVAPVQQVVWLEGLPVGVMVGATPGGAAKLYYIEADALGTPRAIIDPVRDVAVWRWELSGEAFGDSAPDQDPDGDATPFVFDLRFPGQRYDAVSGLNYNYFRDYDAATGRYVQSDPIGLRGGVSTYMYASSNPMTFIDANGLRTVIVVNGNRSGHPFTWRGTHVGLYVDSGSGTGVPFLYDPHGSYFLELGRVLSNEYFFEGADANLENYLSFQLEDGPDVRTYEFDTTAEQEMEMINRLIRGVYTDGYTCADGVSSLVDGIGPFKEMGFHLTPNSLEKKLRDLKGIVDPNPFIPNPYLRDPFK